MPKKTKRKRGTSLEQSAEKLLKMSAFIGPEVGAIMQNPGKDGIGQAIAMKTGLNPITQTFDPSRLLYGWGPPVMFMLVSRGYHKLSGIIRRL